MVHERHINQVIIVAVCVLALGRPVSADTVSGSSAGSSGESSRIADDNVHPLTSKKAAFGMYIAFGPAIAGVDLRVGRVYGYVSGSLLMPLLYDHLKIDLAFGMGPTFRFFSDKWAFDVFGTVQADFEGINKLDVILAVGAGFGWRYVHPKGFTVGFKLPFLGYAIPVHTPSGFWDLNSNPMRVAYYYFTFAKSVPAISIGYTF